MPSNPGRIIGDIKSFMSRHDEDYSHWYIGVTDDPITSLLEDHKVDINVDLWLCSEAFTDQEARNVEERFVKEWGMDGDCAESDSGRFVYAYLKSANTEP